MAEGLGESGLSERGQRFSRSLFDVNQAMLDRILGRENTSMGNVDVSNLFQPMDLPGGRFTPGASPLQAQAFQGAGQFGAGQFGGQQARMGAIANQLAANPSFQFDPAQTNQFFTEQIENPALRTFRNQLMPQIASRFLPGGQTGAALKTATGAAGDLAANLASQRSSFMRGDQQLGAEFMERALGRQAGGIGMSQSEDLRRLSVPFQLGGAERGIAGQQGAEDFSRFMFQQPFASPNLAMFQGLAGDPMSNFGQSFGGLGGLQQLLQGA